MRSQRDPKDEPDHIPVEKRLSGDFGSPLELMSTKELTSDQKRAVLKVWLRDLESQPASEEKAAMRASILEALGSLRAADMEAKARARGG